MMSSPETTSNQLTVRLISVAVALSIFFPTLVWGGRLGVYAITCIVVIWSQWEYAGLAFPMARIRYFVPLLLLGGAVLAACQTESFTLAAGSIAVSLIVSSWWVLFSRRTTAQGMHAEWARLLLGVIYVPLTVSFFPLLVLLKDGRGFEWLLLVLAATWGGDGGGYCAGRLFGRTKLFPLISPKKTWEGLVGGIFGALLLSVGFKIFLFHRIRWVDCIIFPILIDFAGVTGDLVESMIKRDVNVKDSGTFLPGHGGMLDRIDSVVFTLPFAYLYVKLFAP